MSAYAEFKTEFRDADVLVAALEARGMTLEVTSDLDAVLPSFDIATVDEDRSSWQAPDPSLLETFAPDSDQQQALVSASADLDGLDAERRAEGAADGGADLGHGHFPVPAGSGLGLANVASCRKTTRSGRFEANSFGSAPHS